MEGVARTKGAEYVRTEDIAATLQELDDVVSVIMCDRSLLSQEDVDSIRHAQYLLRRSAFVNQTR